MISEPKYERERGRRTGVDAHEDADGDAIPHLAVHLRRDEQCNVPVGEHGEGQVDEFRSGQQVVAVLDPLHDSDCRLFL